MLTTAQKATLKAAILATPEAAAIYAAGDLQGLADYYNVIATPAWWVWKTRLEKAEITQATSVDGTVFTWVGNGFITRAAGEQAAWSQLFDADGTVNPSLLNTRQAFSDIFSGTGQAALNRAHLLAVARRSATRLEKLFSSGTGSTAAPATLGTGEAGVVIEGELSYTELIGL